MKCMRVRSTFFHCRSSYIPWGRMAVCSLINRWCAPYEFKQAPGSISLSLSFPPTPPLITDVAFYLAHTNCHWPPAHGPIEEAAKYNNYLCVRVCLWWWTNFLNRSCGFPVNRWARAQVNRPVERKLMCSRFETQSTPSAHSIQEGEENHSGKWNNAVPVRR